MMEDKTPLERDIERHELSRTPLKVKILIFLLLIGLLGVSFYSFKLRSMLQMKEQEISEIKEMFQKERVELISQMKRLSLERPECRKGE
jgi:Tfp pilus assembly protein PilO